MVPPKQLPGFYFFQLSLVPILHLSFYLCPDGCPNFLPMCLGRVATLTCIFITRQIGSKSIGIRQPAFFAAKVCYLLIFKVSMNLSSQWYISVKKVMNSTVNHWSYLDHPLNMEKQVVMILGDIYLPKWWIVFSFDHDPYIIWSSTSQFCLFQRRHGWLADSKIWYGPSNGCKNQILPILMNHIIWEPWF